MIAKVIKNITRPNDLIPIFLIFGIYLQMLKFDSFLFIINQNVVAIKIIIKEIQKNMVEKQVKVTSN